MLIERIKNRVNKAMFNRVVNGIADTPAMASDLTSDVVVTSLVYSKGLNMALLAIKSFLSKFGAARVELLNDGSLTSDDKQLIANQIKDCVVIDIADVDVGDCPRGGCWERLIYIIRRSRDAYVIQVDTDTVTFANVAEVYDNYKRNSSFTIGAPMWQERVDLDYLASYSNVPGEQHVQSLGEGKLADLNGIGLTSYLRGCAAFTGFAKGCFDFDVLENFSQQMANLLGQQKWQDWGSEQFASNVMISLDNNANILPWPKYQNYKFPEFSAQVQGRASVIHFIGSTRFSDRQYQKLAKTVIKKLQGAEEATDFEG